MRRRIEWPFLLKLAGHLVMGATLGTGLALALLMMDTGRIFEMIVSSAQPPMASPMMATFRPRCFGSGLGCRSALAAPRSFCPFGE